MPKIYSPLFKSILLTLAISACKVVQKTPDTNVVADQPVTSDTTLVDSTMLTILPPPVQDSVVIAVHRILKDTISIIGVGDIMMGTNFPDNSYLPPSNGITLWSEVKDTLKDADVTFGNLEGVILNEGGEAKHCNNPKLCYIFRSPERLMSNLVDAGFDVMSTANNHAGDFGNTGRKNTMKVLDSLNIEHAGQLNKPYATFMVDGMKYGFAAFAPNSGTVSINDYENAKKIVQHLDSISDIVIVSFHGGAEGSDHQHVTGRNEYYLGENRGNVKRFAHTVIDAGADVVFGHGPHVTRAMEVYNKRFIAYSLGNFCTYARFNLRGPNGIAPIVKVYTKPDGEFLFGEITSVIQRGAGGPKIDEAKGAIKIIKELIEKDFPDGVIKIDGNGRINYLQN
ncbi:MAG TPA: CapA family protein [Fulvivirga sp.]|nr:CapA family protein [Fulvivirga sp.]